MLLLRVGKSFTRLSLVGVRANSSTAAVAKAPEKIEVFVDDQSVLVEPGTTVLQVSSSEVLPKRIKLGYTLE